MNRTPSIIMAFVVVFLSVLAGSTMVILVTGLTGADQSDKLLAYISIFLGQGFIAVPLLLYLVNQHIPLQKALRLYRIDLKTAIAAVIIAGGTVILIDELDRLTIMLFPNQTGFSNIIEMLTVDSWGAGIILFFGLAVIAPLGEELLFRGYLQQFLEDHWKDTTRAVMVTAMTFALFHMNPYWIIQAYLMGVLLGYLAWHSDSVVPAIILHGVYNGLALIINNFSGNDSTLYLSGDHVSPVWLLFAAGLTGAGLFLLHNQVEVTS